MTTPQTEKLQPSPPARYNEISRHLLQQAEEELEKGDALQASEKVWLAVAHALKAIAQHHGWNHRYHNHLRAEVSYLSLTWNHPDWVTTFSAIENLHINAYEHQRVVSEVRPHLELARSFCQDLTQTWRTTPPNAGHLTDDQEHAQARFLITLTRPLPEQAAHGTELTEAELADLPPVNPLHL